ncbi:MAG: hypothetical protein WCP34_06155 [Pseudomonadota bacterium]
MESLPFRRYLSLSLLVQLAVLITAAALASLVRFNLVEHWLNRLSAEPLALIADAGLAGLTALGLWQIVFHLVRYWREEAALSRLVRNCQSRLGEPLRWVGKYSLARRAYRVADRLLQRQALPDFSLFTSGLSASESLRISTLRFLQDALLVLSVLATAAVLLAIIFKFPDTLPGTTQTLGSKPVSNPLLAGISPLFVGSLGYLILGYFSHRLEEVRSNFLIRLEQVLILTILPRIEAEQRGLRPLRESDAQIINRLDRILVSLALLSDRLGVPHKTVGGSAQLLDKHQPVHSGHETAHETF